MSKEKKQKKEKVKYVDDGRTIADMSRVGGGSAPRKDGQKATFKESLKTYFAAVRLMFKPMLVTLGIITLAFFIMWLLLQLALSA